MDRELTRKDNSPHRQRWRLLREIERMFDGPLALLAVVWLVLIIIDFTRGLSAAGLTFSHVIWIIFIVEFVLRFVLAPSKAVFLRHNWLTLLALAIPAVRALRVLRILRVLRGARLLRVVASINRGMGALGRSMQRRRVGYVLALTLIVIFAGAAGMYAFENVPGRPGFQSYLEAVWWTAMLITTIGSEYWPRTAEGQVLTLLLSLYGLGILGYVAGVLATFFIGRDAAAPNGEVAGEKALRELKQEIRLLRTELRQKTKS